MMGHTLQVKFADADAGPPSTAVPSGLTPCDSCYVKHLPASYGVSTKGALPQVHHQPLRARRRTAAPLARHAAADIGGTAVVPPLYRRLSLRA
jgi:hypothetical protein